MGLAKRAPASDAQRRLWFIDRLEGVGAGYNIFRAWRLKGKLDHEAMKRAFETIVARHESLRTRFEEVDGEPVQVIAPFISTEIPLEDLSALNPPEQQERIKEAIRWEAEQPFVLDSGPLVRTKLLRLGPEDHIMLRTMHHIVSDAWSEWVFSRELKALYEAYREGLENPLKPLAVQYSDFAVWQRGLVEDGHFEAGLRYWMEQLAGIPDGLELPTDRSRPTVLSFESERCEVVLDRELVTALRRLSQTHKTTLYVTLLAALGVLLARYSGQDDIVVGSPIANRQDTQLEDLIGFFVNSLAMRMRLSPEMTFRELLAQVLETALGAYEHQDVAFEQVVERLSPQRSLNRTPVFQVMFALQNAPQVAPELDGLAVDLIERDAIPTHFDLMIDALERDGRIRIDWLCKRDLFDRWRIEQMARQYVCLLNSVVANANQEIGQIGILAPEDLQQVVYEWNATKTDYPKDQCLHELFEQQVEQTPEAVAVVCGQARLTYGELNRRANQLAHHLRELGVGPDARVAICLERSPEMVIGLLAILKAGGAYVPLDAQYPAERLRYMLEDSAPAVLLTQGHLRGLVETAAATCAVIELAENAPFWNDASAGDMESTSGGVRPENLAYLIYTSGSTGKPKGVAIEHRNASALIHWANEVFIGEELNGVLASTSICFDLSVFELFVALSRGGKVILVENALQLLSLPMANEVSLINTVPSAMAELVRVSGVPASVSTVNLAGEPLQPRLVNDIYAQKTIKRVFDLYGPSEDATYSTCALRRVMGPATIGRPISNTQVYLLDSHMHPVPMGVIGQLYIGGDGLARCYHQRPELTAEKWIPNPFSASPGVRLYNTGDLGRWRADGTIEFLGRNDSQVKVRGYRIELGEIEARLIEHDEVGEAAVIVREDTAGDRQLVAYYTGAGNGGRTEEVAAEELRQHLAARLPVYMVPAAYVRLARLPLTPNGKLDRKALPEPEGEAYGVRGYEEPQGEIEQRLAAIWGEVLKVERVGRHDNFFEMGGHSLLVVRVIARLRQALNIEVAIRDLFEHPVLVDLATAIEVATQTTLPAITPAQRVEHLPLSFAQQRLWFLAQMGVSHAYHIFYGWRLKGELDRRALRRALDRMVARHEALRTTFVTIDGEPAQQITPAQQSRFDLQEHDLRDRLDTEPQMERLIREEAIRRFDLEQGPLIRGLLIGLGESEHGLLITMHHIVSDGWSMGVFIKELRALYGAFAEGQEDPLPALEVQYADYAVWQRQWLQGEVLSKQAEYWERELAGAPGLLELPTDHVRPAEQEYEGGRVPVALSAELSRGLKQMSQQQGTTLFMTLLAGWGALLSRLSGQQDVVIGTSVANRGRVEIEGLIGLFINTLALRLDMSGTPSVEEVLRRVKQQTLSAQQHQELPFEQVVEVVRPERSLAHSPLFQVLFDWQQNVGGGRLSLPGIELEPLRSEAPVV
ncbi:MAG TPA: amino acid adenylation domain-containing protein, partial [Blastocatellia bacterium]|nr:amino acid adenylation domain-containing protein [Blastocatellia bacterium]